MAPFGRNPEMFGEVRKSLIYIREYHPDLNDIQQQTFQKSISSFKLLEENFDRHIFRKLDAFRHRENVKPHFHPH